MSRIYPLLAFFILFSMVARSQYQMNGDATAISQMQHCYQLTPAEIYKKGSVWNTVQVNLNQNFEVHARLYFGAHDNGADGIAFVLQNASLNALGEHGGGLGYSKMHDWFPGKSLIVEFDTYQNTEPWFNVGDPVADHIAIQKNADPYHVAWTGNSLAAPVAFAADIEDGQWHDVRFSWNATTKTLTTTFMGNTYSYSADILNTVFAGNPMVYWGFTGSTGSPFNGVSPNQQMVCFSTNPPPPPGCGQLRTQTPGGWGAPPQGNNPGAYLHQHFAAAFSSGLTVGDFASGKYVRFTNAQAITDYLPSGGPARALTTAYTNPQTNDVKNTLVSHLVSLTLSMGFDQHDAAFGPAGVQLKDMIIRSGTFANWTVSQFMMEANKVLAGVSTAYTTQQVLETATAINENYVDGTMDNNYLRCPTQQMGRTIMAPPPMEATDETVVNFTTRPNPTSGRVEINIEQGTGQARVQVMNSNGLVVQDHYVPLNGRGQNLRIDLSGQAAGVYLVRVIKGGKAQTQKILLQK